MRVERLLGRQGLYQLSYSRMFVPILTLKFPRVKGESLGDGYIESFNDKLRDELLNRGIFTTLKKVKILIEQWRREYDQNCIPNVPICL